MFHEILMFVCLLKDSKQCCDVTKLDCIIVVRSMLGIFLGTNKHVYPHGTKVPSHALTPINKASLHALYVRDVTLC